MLRSDLLHETNLTNDVESSVAQHAPELGPAPQHTVLRPMPVARPTEPDEPVNHETSADEQLSWFTKKNILLGLSGLVLLVALVVGGIWLFTGNAADAQTTSDTALQASQQDQPLPTGLSVSRQATYDPDAEQITVEITYSTQRAPLSGQFLEVLPATDAEADACPAVSWEGVSAKHHQSSNSGIRADCGWQLDGVEIPANDQLTVTATLPGSVADQQNSMPGSTLPRKQRMLPCRTLRRRLPPTRRSDWSISAGNTVANRLPDPVANHPDPGVAKRTG